MFVEFDYLTEFLHEYFSLSLEMKRDRPYMGSVPIKDMQTPPPTLQKWPYIHERCAMFWNDWKINFPIFIFWVMVDFVCKVLRKCTKKSVKVIIFTRKMHILHNLLKRMKNLFLRFLFFNLWSILYSKFKLSKNVNFFRPESCAMFWNECRNEF